MAGSLAGAFELCWRARVNMARGVVRPKWRCGHGSGMLETSSGGHRRRRDGSVGVVAWAVRRSRLIDSNVEMTERVSWFDHVTADDARRGGTGMRTAPMTRSAIRRFRERIGV